MDEIRKLLANPVFHPVHFGSGASEAEIAEAECAMGVRLPKTYTQFLNRLGYVESPCLSVLGLGPGVDRAYDLVHVTNVERHDADITLPNHLVPIMNDGSGNLYCLDVSNLNDAENPVVFWDHEALQEPEYVPLKVGEDFLSWLVNEIKSLSI